MTTKVLFVCTANLCRSPMAEGVFRALVERAGMADAFEIASAGTSEKFVGQAPAPQAVEMAASRGYDISDIRARQVTGEDIAHFDYPLAMDGSHLVEMRWLAPRALVKRRPLLPLRHGHRSHSGSSPSNRTASGSPGSPSYRVRNSTAPGSATGRRLCSSTSTSSLARKSIAS
jgi:protein-tyrosine-phosphatase